MRRRVSGGETLDASLWALGLVTFGGGQGAGPSSRLFACILAKSKAMVAGAPKPT